jgi:hypothetical protein
VHGRGSCALAAQQLDVSYAPQAAFDAMEAMSLLCGMGVAFVVTGHEFQFQLQKDKPI